MFHTGSPIVSSERWVGNLRPSLVVLAPKKSHLRSQIALPIAHPPLRRGQVGARYRRVYTTAKADSKSRDLYVCMYVCIYIYISVYAHAYTNLCAFMCVATFPSITVSTNPDYRRIHVYRCVPAISICLSKM